MKITNNSSANILAKLGLGVSSGSAKPQFGLLLLGAPRPSLAFGWDVLSWKSPKVSVSPVHKSLKTTVYRSPHRCCPTSLRLFDLCSRNFLQQTSRLFDADKIALFLGKLQCLLQLRLGGCPVRRLVLGHAEMVVENGDFGGSGDHPL